MTQSLVFPCIPLTSDGGGTHEGARVPPAQFGQGVCLGPFVCICVFLGLQNGNLTFCIIFLISLLLSFEATRKKKKKKTTKPLLLTILYQGGAGKTARQNQFLPKDRSPEAEIAMARAMLARKQKYSKLGGPDAPLEAARDTCGWDHCSRANANLNWSQEPCFPAYDLAF